MYYSITLLLLLYDLAFVSISTIYCIIADKLKELIIDFKVFLKQGLIIDFYILIFIVLVVV
jgi:hypothetical protein